MACLWKQKNKEYVSYTEARTALRAVDDAARSHALSFLAGLVQEAGTWSTFGRDFVKRAWPRESRYQTADVSRQFAYLAEQSGEDFPDVVQTILPLIIPTEQLDLTVHRAGEHGEMSLARRFPESMLELLDHLPMRTEAVDRLLVTEAVLVRLPRDRELRPLVVAAS